MLVAKDKVYQKDRHGKKVRDKKGFTRYSRDGGKTVFGDNYRIGIGTKKFKK